MNTPLIDPPPTEIALEQVKLIIKKEALTPKEEGPSKEVPTYGHVDTPLSNPPLEEPAAKLVELVVKREVIEREEPREENLT